MSTLDISENLDELERITHSGFVDQFASQPTHRVASPGRLNVIGEHVDYNDGIVLPAAIERWIFGVFAPSAGNQVVVYDAKYTESITIDLAEELKPQKGEWANYIKGVFAQFQKQGIQIPAFNACIYSNVPTGGGLSSSAALEALFATIVETLLESPMDKMEKALLCQKAEHEFAGVPCGIMDQAAVILGEQNHLLKLDCRDLSVETVPFTSEELGLMIIDSKVHHELADGEYGKRRASCEQVRDILGLSSLRDATMDQLDAANIDDDVLYRRGKHVITEIERIEAAIEVLKVDDFVALGELINGSHFSLSHDCEVSCPELDFITDQARKHPGVLGARMMGGGFGGSAILLVRKDQAEAVAAKIDQAYQEAYNLKAAFFLTNPSQGVSVSPLS